MACDREFFEKLIDLVKSKRCIYSKRDAFYYNKLQKAKVWAEIAELTGKSADECRNRWKLLRERFVKEIRKKQMPSGSGMDTWEFFDRLQFLKGYTTPRGTRCNEILADEDIKPSTSHESFLILPNTSPVPDTSPELCEPPRHIRSRKRKSSSSLDVMYEKFDETFKKIEGKVVTSLEPDADELFMQTVISMMKPLPESAKDDFKSDIFAKLIELRKQFRK